MSQRPKKGILALSSCHLLHLILAGVGDWNKSSHLRLPPKRESIYLHMSHKPKKGTCSVILPSPSKRYFLEHFSPHITSHEDQRRGSLLCPPAVSFTSFWRELEIGTKVHISDSRQKDRVISTCHKDQRRGSLLCHPAVSFKKIFLRAFLSTHHKSRRPKKGILALPPCCLLHLILAGVGDWNKISYLQHLPKRFYLEHFSPHITSHKAKRRGPCHLFFQNL